jgi:hypothetical protein
MIVTNVPIELDARGVVAWCDVEAYVGEFGELDLVNLRIKSLTSENIEVDRSEMGNLAIVASERLASVNFKRNQEELMPYFRSQY